VNLREEEEQLLAGPKEESRTTAAMRKFVQEEEERLFLEKGPLRTKAQAIGTQILLCLTINYNFLVFFKTCIMSGIQDYLRENKLVFIN
jgi:hypothetical protein